MTEMTVNIRLESDSDHESIGQVNCLAFGQDAETQLVDALRDGGYVRLSLVAELDGQIVGHILFSDIQIVCDADSVDAADLYSQAGRSVKPTPPSSNQLLDSLNKNEVRFPFLRLAGDPPKSDSNSLVAVLSAQRTCIFDICTSEAYPEIAGDCQRQQGRLNHALTVNGISTVQFPSSPRRRAHSRRS